MIKCKNCGGLTEYKGESHCPNCRTEYTVTPLEATDMMKEARAAVKSRDYETARENVHFLANRGILDAEREYGAMLEKGRILPRDLDLASRYYLSAAKKNDPYSAYKYSCLTARSDEKISDFWLFYAALLGSKEAFPKAAEAYRRIGDEETATYYYSLAADCDDTHAIFAMAKRYYNGIGAPQSEECAKWYMDRLTLPPIYAIRLKLMLRGITPKEAPKVPFIHREAILRRLSRDAERFGFSEARLGLAKMLAEGGDAKALYDLGRLLAEGVGGPSDPEGAITALENAQALGSSDAAKYLGDMFISGKIVPRDISRALGHYEHATSLGYSSAYEAMGDIFREGELVPCNIAYAIELYKTGGNMGDESCRNKAIELTSERERLYQMAMTLESTDPQRAFDALSLSAAMGYVPSHRELGRFFENGIGTETDRHAAFFWYSFAVKKGDMDALYDLGRCYAHGIGVAFDFDLAMDTLLKAIRYGSSKAKDEFNRLKANKTKALSRQLFSKAMRLLYQQKYREARALLEICYEAGNPQAAYTLGCMYEFGLGGFTDREGAKSLYEYSFREKFRDPRQEYKLKILRMTR